MRKNRMCWGLTIFLPCNMQTAHRPKLPKRWFRQDCAVDSCYEVQASLDFVTTSSIHGVVDSTVLTTSWSFLLVTANNAEAIKNNEKLKALMTCLQNIMIKSFKISKTTPLFQMTKSKQDGGNLPYHKVICTRSFKPSTKAPLSLSLSRAIHSISNYSRQTSDGLWN